MLFSVMLNLPGLANPVLSYDESKQQLSPYFEKFIECINGAWKQWMEYPLRHTLDNRARASFVNAAIVYRAKAEFSGLEPFAKFTVTGNSFFLYVGDHVKLRFKKFSPDGTYSNLMTGRQIALQLQKNIPGMLPGTYLTVGYQLDKLQQNIKARMVTLQVKNKIEYFIDLDEEVASGSNKIAAMPPMPSPSPARRRVKLRENFKKNTGKAKGHAARAE